VLGGSSHRGTAPLVYHDGGVGSLAASWRAWAGRLAMRGAIGIPSPARPTATRSARRWTTRTAATASKRTAAVRVRPQMVAGPDVCACAGTDDHLTTRKAW